MNQTIIEAVRVRGADGVDVEYFWDPVTWYLVRDDHPFLDILTRGYPVRPAHDAIISKLSEPCEEGMQWQRWDLSEELSRRRRFGEISAVLKVPKDSMLRCYVIPTALLSYRDVITMVEDVEIELGLPASWDILADRPDRSWSRPLDRPRSLTPSETLNLIEEEVCVASSIRRDPFKELGPSSRRDAPLAENALVSQWAMRRSSQLRGLSELLEVGIEAARVKSALNSPEKRQEKNDAELDRLNSILRRSGELTVLLAGFINEVELSTQIYPSPLFQRDHRLRLLLRVFAPNPSEAIAETESESSTYPPLVLNHLWELWGLVWIAKELRNHGFSGICSVEAIDSVRRCSWHLTREGVTIQLDFEAEPAFVDYDHIPPLHERSVPALEWAARHQEIDAERPFLGLELKCSPDYLIRITTPTSKALLVGDACLTSSQHHGKKGDRTTSKPYTVEKYRRTIGWAVDDQMIRCHAMGGFVIFPPPAQEWAEFEAMPGASDCMLLCPSPRGDAEASRRLKILLEAIVPELGDPAASPDKLQSQKH